MYQKNKIRKIFIFLFTGIMLTACTSKDALLFEEGKLLYKEKNYSSAVEKFKLAISLNPQEGEYYQYLGDSYRYLDSCEQAITFYNKAIENNVYGFEITLNAGDAYYKCGDYKNAEALSDLAKKIQPEHWLPYRNLSLIYFDSEKKDKAFSMIDSAIARNPKEYELHFLKFDFLSRLDRHQESLSAINMAIELNDSTADLYNHKGIVLGKLNKNQEAVESFSEAIKLDSINGNYYHNRGYAYSLLKQKDLACSDYKKSLDYENDEYVELINDYCK